MAKKTDARKKGKQLTKSELVKKVEKAMPGWKVVAPAARGARSDARPDGPPAADARLPSMKELRRKFLGSSSVRRDAPEPPLTDETESLDVESGEVRSRVWFNKETGAPTIKKG